MNTPVVSQVATFICHDAEEALYWDQFLKQCSGAHFEQTVAWGRLKQIYGWKPIWFWVTRDDQIIGGAMMLTRHAGRFASVGYIERGPVWDSKDPEAMDLVMKALSQHILSLRLTYLVIAPPYCGNEIVPLLESMRFRQKPSGLHPTGVGKATLLIDLRKDEDQLLAEMSMTKRQNIRRAIRKGVQIRLGDDSDAEIMRDLMWSACKRRGTAPSPSQPDFFAILWRELGPSGLVKFFIAEVDGQPVSAGTVQVFGGVSQLWRVGWSGTHDRINPNDLLHWEMIKWAKRSGCQVFDFMHIKPDHARAILRGERINDSYSGVTDFKTSFGGQLVVLPDLYYRSYNPIVQLAFDLGAARILQSNICGNAFHYAFSMSQYRFSS